MEPTVPEPTSLLCVTPSCRACVKDVLAGGTPADRPALMRLAEHGYVVQRDGRRRLRVPLFEDWLTGYRDGFTGGTAGLWPALGSPASRR